MKVKIFHQRFNAELNALGVPQDIVERRNAIKKLFNISKHNASSILNMMLIPDKVTLEKIANELEVNVDWLIGDSIKKRPD